MGFCIPNSMESVEAFCGGHFIKHKTLISEGCYAQNEFCFFKSR